MKGLTFTNGTIEVDVEGTTGLGPSIGFHRRDSATYELFYVRPQPDCATGPHCVQYAPVTKNGAFTLPLDAGDNDVVVGVANAFFGWGLMLRLDDAAGVTLTASTR